MKTRIGNLALLSLSVMVTLIFSEVLLYFLYPQAYIYPRFKFSAEYGNLLYEDTTMINKYGNKWEFRYRINKQGYRGKLIEIKERYDKKNIVVLGDSYSFGAGVDEGSVYSQVLDSLLEDYDVINLAVGGWGLTQEIRRFYEFGMLYRPKIVILQFCSNDLDDNVRNRVTLIQDGRFRFVNSALSINGIKKYLSYCIIQKSQIYNLFRNRTFSFFEGRVVRTGIEELKRDAAQPAIDVREGLYDDLLETFAHDLHERGIRLILISVNNELEQFDAIHRKVKELNENGMITYLETANWFDIKDRKYASPEGHGWGNMAHEVIGRKLADHILSLREKQR